MCKINFNVNFSWRIIVKTNLDVTEEETAIATTSATMFYLYLQCHFTAFTAYIGIDCIASSHKQ